MINPHLTTFCSFLLRIESSVYNKTPSKPVTYIIHYKISFFFAMPCVCFTGYFLSHMLRNLYNNKTESYIIFKYHKWENNKLAFILRLIVFLKNSIFLVISTMAYGTRIISAVAAYVISASGYPGIMSSVNIGSLNILVD